MKVLIRLKSKLFTEILSRALKRERDIELYNGREGKNGAPDIIVVDFQSLTTLGGNIYARSKLVLIDTGLKKEQIVSLVGSYKISGIIAPYTDLQLFKKALKVINEGQIWVDNEFLKAFILNPPEEEKDAQITFSEKEKEIIKYICQGLTNKEIASKLKLSEQTVKTHINKIFKKLGLSNRFQLVSLFSNSHGIDQKL